MPTTRILGAIVIVGGIILVFIAFASMNVAANELGDTITVDACRRVIDASLRGDAPAESDMSVIAAFFN